MEYLDGPVLGIETSCDETSVAVVVGKRILSNVVSSQADLHKKWGGVVPEAAARKHTEALLPAIEKALEQSRLSLKEIKGIGVTNRPGLIGALSVGVSGAKALAFSLNVPFIGIHHLEAHVLSPAIVSEITFPHVCLLVSGGHTELIRVTEPGHYEKLGGTIDDAAGEAFDKCARALGLGYPGGPAIQTAAKNGNSKKYELPYGLTEPTFNFSFSGLKTAVVYLARDEGPNLDIPSAAASFEETITDVLARRAISACIETDSTMLTLVGGVAANKRLRAKMNQMAGEHRIDFVTPPIELCTDNAAMIAHVASWRLANGESDDFEMDTIAITSLTGDNDDRRTTNT